MAGGDKHRELVYQCMDERDWSWLEDTVLGMTNDGFNRNDYFHNLVKTVLSIARKCCVIFVGHATDLILPKDHGLRVRLAATCGFCDRLCAEERGVTANRAAKNLAEFEHERAQFIHRHFNVNADEETRHDLMVNLERFPTDGAVATILAALRAQGIDA